MISDVVQRWRAHRALYRPAGEPIATHRFEVAAIPDDTTARAFVEAHHYSRSYVAARRRFGLFERGGELVGVAVYDQPVHPNVLACLPAPDEGLGLGRLVLLDRVPANGESWFLARTRELLVAEGFTGSVQFADDVPRRTSTGVVVLPGHVGTVYQASNAIYLGRGRPASLWLLADGTVLAPRSLVKIRKGERGAGPAQQRLEAVGAPPRAADEDGAAWLARALPAIARPLRHPGCHKYVLGFTPAVRRRLPASLPFPKMIAEPPRRAA